MRMWIRYSIALLCMMGFVFVRFRESELFYDPFISFFKGYYQESPLPSLEKGRLFLNLTARFSIHMLLSLVILWVAFMEKGIIKFAAILYGIIFLGLMLVLVYQIDTYRIGANGGLFYTRKFLIQPLLIFIMLPAFFYYRKVNS